MLTEHRTVEVTPSGSFIATEHLRPVRARAGGAWAAIDTTLVARNGAYVPRASTVDLRISAGGDGPLVSMTRAGRTLAFTWPGRLPAPVVDGDQAMYRSVIDGVDLIVKADSDGFSHLLRVNTAQAAKDTRLARLAFGVRSAGLRLEKDSAGVLRAVSTVGSGALFVAPEPTMWDSAGASRAAAVAADAADGPLDGSRVADVAVELAERELALVPDKGLLTGTDTVFPVYIDPAWRTESAYVWAMVSSGYPSEAYWFFDNKPDEGSGFCDLSRDYKCVKDQIKRVMFRMPISYFAGKHVISAAFTAYNNTSFSCGVNRRVDLYRVATFTSTTNWNTDGWPKYLTNRSVGYCSETPVEFGGTAVTEEIRSLVNAGSSTVSLGLKAYDETTMDYWKRFAAKAHLRVEYNTPPQQPKMSDLTFDPGGACSGTSVYVSRLPELRATLYDADMASAKQLTGQFIVLWDHDGDGTLTTQWSANVGPKTSGSPFAIQIPSTANLPQDLQAYWAVRAWDGYQWSPWSHAGSATGCYFKLNGSVPAGPEISSKDGQYPRSDPYNEADPWYPGVGRYGTFIIKSTSTDVVKYQVGINQNPAPTSNWVPDATGRAEVPLAPDHAGINYVTAVAVNNAGTSSDVVTYHFRVLAGSPSKAAWKLDEPAGSATLNDVNGAFPASVTGGVTLGIAGMDGTSMKLDGATGRAATSAPVVDTSQSFTFSAWARLPQTKPNHAAVVVGQTGAQRSAVELYYSSGYNRWVFVRNETDTLNTTSVMAMSPVNPPGATWTHLVGVYDVVKKHIRLYVNGALVDTQPYTKPWNATGSVKFGAGWYGSFGNYFQGDIDDVRIFDRIVSADEVRDLYTQNPTVSARCKLNGPVGGTTSPDDSGNGHNVSLRGGANIQDYSGLIGDPSNGLTLDGVDDYAETTGPVLTSTVESFTVAGWVIAAGAPGAKATVFSQVGAADLGFTLRYSPAANGNAGGYEIEMPNPGTAQDDWPKVDHPEYAAGPGGWDHVAIVYDAFAKQMRLYVNGQLYQVEDDVSWRSNTVGVNATESLQIGRTKVNGAWGEYWPGVIDDVWVFRGVASDEQIQRLAIPVEYSTNEL